MKQRGLCPLMRNSHQREQVNVLRTVIHKCWFYDQESCLYGCHQSKVKGIPSMASEVTEDRSQAT